jgi:putative hydrolase of the HAD superfamily
MRALIFDVGRVLVHWAPQVIENALSQLCPAPPEQIHAAQQAVRHELSVGSLGAEAYHHYLVEAVGMDPAWDRFFFAYCLGLCRNEQGLAYAAELKRRGVAIGVISNTNDVHARWLRKEIPEFTSFDSVILSSDVGLTKPDVAIYARCLRELGVLPEHALFVDDLPENVAGAERAGMAGLLHREWDDSIPRIEAWLTI